MDGSCVRQFEFHGIFYGSPIGTSGPVEHGRPLGSAKLPPCISPARDEGPPPPVGKVRLFSVKGEPVSSVIYAPDQGALVYSSR